MWASLFSGGHATYGGLKTYEPYDGKLQGIQGYLDAVRDGRLTGGAADFRQIHRFFDESGLTLVGMRPDDGLAGNEPLRFKCIHNEETLLVYLANPDGEKPETDRPSETTPTLSLQLPPGTYKGRWFNPGDRFMERRGQGERACRKVDGARGGGLGVDSQEGVVIEVSSRMQRGLRGRFARDLVLFVEKTGRAVVFSCMAAWLDASTKWGADWRR